MSEHEAIGFEGEVMALMRLAVINPPRVVLTTPHAPRNEAYTRTTRPQTQQSSVYFVFEPTFPDLNPSSCSAGSTALCLTLG